MDAVEVAKKVVEIFRRCNSKIKEVVRKSKIEGFATYSFECNVENITIKVNDIAHGTDDE